MAFDLSLVYYDVVFFVVLVFYLCEGNSNKQNRFDQLKISYYSRQYVEELES